MPEAHPMDSASAHVTTRLGPHVEQRHLEVGRGYPGGAPVVVTGRDSTLAIDAALGLTPIDHDGFLLSHFHEDHVFGVGSSGLPVFACPLDLPAIHTWEGFERFSGYRNSDWRTMVQVEFSWTASPHAQPLSTERPIDLGGVTITPIHLPGHTPGHCGFLIEPDGVLYLGDIDLSSFGPYYGDAAASLEESIASIEQVRDIEARVYTTFHHRGHFVGRPAFTVALENHRAAIDARHERVLTLLDSGLGDAESMTGRGVVYRVGTSPPWGLEAERRMIAQHLDLATNFACVASCTARDRA
jgi:glyoxylase-like metal-dependent hydrolase (beta-lactamase superfamily II)